MTERVVGGLDGCRAGWVLVTVPADDAAGAAVLDVSVVANLDTVRADLEAGRLVAAAIDIPIGLPSRVPRPCDREARRLLGPRRSSVFPAPVRSAVAVGTYAQSCARPAAPAAGHYRGSCTTSCPRSARSMRCSRPPSRHSSSRCTPSSASRSSRAPRCGSTSARPTAGPNGCPPCAPRSATSPQSSAHRRPGRNRTTCSMRGRRLDGPPLRGAPPPPARWRARPTGAADGDHRLSPVQGCFRDSRRCSARCCSCRPCRCCRCCRCCPATSSPTRPTPIHPGRAAAGSASPARPAAPSSCPTPS